MSAQTIFAILWGWTLAAIIVGLLFARMLRPRVSESDEECAAHCHAELDGAGLPAGLIDHFHSGSISPKSEQDHA